MRFLRLTLLLSIILFQINSSTAQVDKSNYSLLWEISGNGLTKPSYLFGTMHVKDKRAFEFSDSLLFKMEECEAFANEVHPDSAFLFYSKIHYGRDTTDFLKKMLSPEAYERLKKQLQEEEGIAFDSLKNKNPYFIESLFDKKPKEKEDDKELFVDLYLYKLARKSGMRTYGLEKMEDHRSMVDLFFQNFEASPTQDSSVQDSSFQLTFDQGIEFLLNIYRTGNLDLIHATVNSGDSLYNDASLTKRNIIMVENMEKIIHKHSLFATMGVAHLPGEDGVIQLLQNNGYTLRPVSAAFTGMAEKYQIKEKEILWETYREEYHKFKIDLPGKPYVWEYEKLGFRFFEHYLFYNDIIEDIDYTVKVHTDFKEDETSIDSFLNKSIKNFFFRFQKDVEITTKKINLNDMEGFEFSGQPDSLHHIRGRVFFNGSAAYFAVARRKDDQLNHPDINRFFASLRIAKPRAFGWDKFTSEEGAFSISTPYDPNYSPLDFPVPDPATGVTYNIRMHVYTIRDMDNGRVFFARYNDIGEGRYIENDSALFDLALEDFKSRQGEPDSVFTIEKQGYEGREIIYIKSGFMMRIQYYLRGSRMYLLLAQNFNSTKNDADLDEFFNSFYFEPFKESTFIKYNSKQGGFNINFPKEPKVTFDTLNNYDYPLESSISHYSEDVNTGTSYFAFTSKLSPYFQIDTLENYLDNYADNIVAYTDTLISKDTISINGFSGRYSIIQSTVHQNTLHHYLCFRGHQLMEFYVYANKEAKDEQITAFLNSFQIIDTIVSNNLTSRKIDHIMEGFYSKDSVTNMKAENAMRQHPWVESELHHVYKALENEYPNDTLEYPTTIGMLCNIFHDTQDSNTVNILVENYHKFPENEIRKRKILTALKNEKLDGGIDEFLNIFKDYTPTSINDNNYVLNLFLYPFSDSLELLVDNYDMLMSKYQKDSIWQSYISNALTNLVNNDSIDYSFVNKDRTIFMDDIKEIVLEEKLLTKDSIDGIERQWQLINLFQIVRKLDLEKSDIKYLKKLLKIKNRYTCRNIINTLVYHKEKVSKKYWKYIEQDPSSKLGLLYDLNSDSLLHKAPKKWLDKKEIALLQLQVLIDDEYYFSLKKEDLKPVKSFPFTYDKVDYNILVYQFTDPEEKDNHYALVSYPIGKNVFFKNISYPTIYHVSYEAVEKDKLEEWIEEGMDWYKKQNIRLEKEAAEKLDAAEVEEKKSK